MFPFSSFFHTLKWKWHMIINKIDNHYIIKLLGENIDIYDTKKIEEITKKIITKISKKQKLENYIHLEFYLNKNYGTIIKLSHHNSPIVNKKEKAVKITINTDTKFLYQIYGLNNDNEKYCILMLAILQLDNNC